MSKESKLLQRNKSELFSLIRNLPTLGDTLELHESDQRHAWDGESVMES